MFPFNQGSCRREKPQIHVFRAFEARRKQKNLKHVQPNTKNQNEQPLQSPSFLQLKKDLTYRNGSPKTGSPGLQILK